MKAGASISITSFWPRARGHSYFGNDTWSANAPGLKSIDDATAIRRRLLLAFERAETCDDPVERERLMRFLIVGAGPTGVELAGAIAELAHFTLAADFRRIDPRSAKVTLIEAGPRVLPAFDEAMSAYARCALERLNVGGPRRFARDRLRRGRGRDRR